MLLLKLLGLVATGTLLVPVILLVVFKLSRYKQFTALFCYFFIAFCYNFFSQNFIPVSENFLTYFGLFNNYLDPPLMMLFLTYFISPKYRKQSFIGIGIFVVFEIVTISIYGLTTKSNNIILGPAVILILAVASYLFAYQVKETVSTGKRVGRLLMLSTIIFWYVGAGSLYLFYYLLDMINITDAILMNNLLIILFSIVFCIGVFKENINIQQQKEIEQTAKELKALYGEEGEESTIQQSAIVLDMLPFPERDHRNQKV